MVLFDLQPRLLGTLVELRPMVPADWSELFAVAADPLIWEVHPARDRYKEERFREYFYEGLESGGALVAMDRKTGAIVGASRYFWYGPDKNEMGIGWTFLARSYWGGIYNGEIKRLMLDHAFQYVDRVVFRVGVGNIRSQKAMKKIGGILIGRIAERNLGGTTPDLFEFEIRRRAQQEPADSNHYPLDSY